MDKVKKFLENYVQWLALALGVAFVAYSGYTFIYSQPDAVSSVGSQNNVTPPEVDKIVADGPAKQLSQELGNKTANPIPEISPTYPDDHVISPIQKAPDAPAVVTPWTPMNAPEIPEGVKATDLSPQKLAVKALPVVPAIVKLSLSGGHSNVPAPASPAGAAPVPAGNGPSAVDKNWESVEGEIPVDQLAKAMNDAGIPPAFHTTAILRVELFREEKLPNGSWSEPTQVPSLDIDPLKDLPGNNAPVGDQNNYRTWAESNVALICQPPFYQVLQGDVWYEPGTPNPNVVDEVVVDDGFDPDHPGNFKGDPNTLTPPHREIYDKYMADKAKRDAAQQRNQNRNNIPSIPPGGGTPGYIPPVNNGGGTGGGNGGGGGRGGRNRGLVADPQRARPGEIVVPPPDFPPGRFPGGYPGGMPMQPQQGQPAGPANTAAAQATLPPGSFDPAAPQAQNGQGGAAPAAQNIRVWAHDATAVSGHTYRYMMKYVITNPVAHTSNLCDPQSLAQIFSIDSADSAWTDPVSVESDTSFYATEMKGHGIRFDVFKWKNGMWQMQDTVAGPGDMVGGVDPNGNKTDFTTGWTLVDIRDDPRDTDNKIIVLVSETGSIKKKDLNFDNHSLQFQHLREEVAKNKPAAAGAGTPGPNM